MGVEISAGAEEFVDVEDKRIFGLADMKAEAARFGPRQGLLRRQVWRTRPASPGVMQIIWSRRRIMIYSLS